MPAEKELLNSTVAADSMKNGEEFYIGADTALSLRWRVIPQRNLLQLLNNAANVGESATADGSAELLLSRQLEPRLMQLLCLLADAKGQVLTRDTLMESLWPRVIVNENSLTRAISDLRKALVLPAGFTQATANPGLIETVPKRGYRLNAQLIPAHQNHPAVALHVPQQHRQTHEVLRTSGFRHLLQRYTTLPYPAIAAAMLISAALSSFWTMTLTDTKGSTQNPLVAQSGITTPEPDSASGQLVQDRLLPETGRLQDRVLSETPELPEGLQWLESVHKDTDLTLQNAWMNETGLPQISNTVIAPGGHMMAFVEQFPGQSQLRLRSLTSPEEAWTVFTSSSPITHLQWSPLDAGLLFTVEDKDSVVKASLTDLTGQNVSASTRLARLMLLDLETLQIRELYRRLMPAGDDQSQTVGNLT